MKPAKTAAQKTAAAVAYAPTCPVCGTNVMRLWRVYARRPRMMWVCDPCEYRKPVVEMKKERRG